GGCSALIFHAKTQRSQRRKGESNSSITFETLTRLCAFASLREIFTCGSVIILDVRPVLSAEQIREIDRLTVENYHTPSLLLMEAASAACLEAVRAHLDGELAGRKALVLCGKGNNGGDGAALARAMSRAGMHCSVVLFGKLSETSGDARANFEAASRLASFEAGSP